MATDNAPDVELRALYEQFARAPTIEARQEIWNTIVAHRRRNEVRVGTEAATARAEVVEQHKRRRFWLF